MLLGHSLVAGSGPSGRLLGLEAARDTDIQSAGGPCSKCDEEEESEEH